MTGQLPVLPWSRTFALCWAGLANRPGRSLLTFTGIAVVVAFLMSTLAYQNILHHLTGMDDVHTRAYLERAGVVVGEAGDQAHQEDQRMWLLGLSVLLCLAGVTNTMLMSVMERFQEIGTLKCLGALDRFVVRLFVLESLIIGFSGSLVGAAVGYCICVLQVGAVLKFSLVPGGQYLSTLLVCFPVALVAGTLLAVLSCLYPAYVAARMEPVEAMRSEI